MTKLRWLLLIDSSSAQTEVMQGVPLNDAANEMLRLRYIYFKALMMIIEAKVDVASDTFLFYSNLLVAFWATEYLALSTDLLPEMLRKVEENEEHIFNRHGYYGAWAMQAAHGVC